MAPGKPATRIGRSAVLLAVRIGVTQPDRLADHGFGADGLGLLSDKLLRP
jgi:hypothetical protein